LNQMIPTRQLRQPNSTPLSFSGDRTEFRGLVERGASLELITFGFYRFWLATDIRRHLWSHTSIDGDAAEYTGRGKELLIGFLFALAILVPVYLAYFLVGIEAGRYKAFASVPLVLFFYLFGQFAIYRARGYRLNRTVWRGVRFWMDGSGWAYAWRATLWGLLALVTLGLALPWCKAALERYKMRHCYYGDLQGSFEGRSWEFFKLGFKLWLMAALPWIAAMLMAVIEPPGEDFIVGLAMLVWFVSIPFIYGSFKAVEWRWWVSGIRFGDVSFKSDLSSGALIGLYWKVIGWFLLIAALLIAYVLTCFWWMVGFGDNAHLAARLQANTGLMVASAIGYLAFILAFNVVVRIYLIGDLWKRVAASTTVQNIEAVSNDAAQVSRCGRLDERVAGRHGIDAIVGWSIAAAASIVAVVLVGVPLAADRLAPLVSDAIERRIGDAAEKQTVLSFGGKQCTDAPGRAVFDKLVGRIIEAAEVKTPIKAGVLATPVPNAFVLPGGTVYLLSGLLARAENPDEIAGILAHELGHIRHRDIARNLIYNGGASLLIGLFFGDITVSGASIYVSGSLVTASSREAEASADAFSIDVMHHLGRPTRPMAELIFRLNRSQPILSREPFIEDRLKRMSEENRAPSGPPLLNANEWAALKSICNSGD